jgi:hypothetical protein
MTGLLIETTGTAVAASERFAEGVVPALERALLKTSLLLGKKVAENVEAFKETEGTRRLARSFLVPEPAGEDGFMLGGHSPVYAAPHEYGATITPKHGEYLVFETPDGAWHSVKEVHIREKRYARDALDWLEETKAAEGFLAAELTAEFSV